MLDGNGTPELERNKQTCVPNRQKSGGKSGLLAYGQRVVLVQPLHALVGAISIA